MDNFKLCKMCVHGHEELCEGHVTCGDVVELEQRTAALLEAAREMFEILCRKPGGKLWPTEKEIERMMIRWWRRINREDGKP